MPVKGCDAGIGLYVLRKWEIDIFIRVWYSQITIDN